MNSSHAFTYLFSILSIPTALGLTSVACASGETQEKPSSYSTVFQLKTKSGTRIGNALGSEEKEKKASKENVEYIRTWLDRGAKKITKCYTNVVLKRDTLVTNNPRLLVNVRVSFEAIDRKTTTLTMDLTADRTVSDKFLPCVAQAYQNIDFDPNLAGLIPNSFEITVRFPIKFSGAELK